MKPSDTRLELGQRSVIQERIDDISAVQWITSHTTRTDFGSESDVRRFEAMYS